MADTIMSAKNSFQEGLIMDFTPDNTQATCLTSALNATLLTFNGNEMSLQNDMGNGRVETARLPEGYIPVGTCEFGDIIYIVSYNPITNKSQIGCFPSPERNISSEEICDLGQILSSDEFQVFDKDGNPTGELLRTSIKKVLIGNKKLNPGDKYIIYSDAKEIEKNIGKLSDYGHFLDENGKYTDNNENNYTINETHGTLPKYVKLHVVSIDDSNKVTYLDTTTKWYNTTLKNENDDDNNWYKYYINSVNDKNINGNNVPDIDSYRTLLQSGWSIFSSKVPGKLAILAELEVADSFSCTYSLEECNIYYKGNKQKNNQEEDTENGVIYKEYKLILHPDAQYSNIKPVFLCITQSLFNKEYEKEVEGKMKYHIAYKDGVLMDDTVKDALKKRWTLEYNNEKISKINTDIKFIIPHKERIDGIEYPINSDSFIYNFAVVPAMEFGRLDYLKVPLTIDFNKIGTGEVILNTWKYYNSEESSMLTFGIETYPKPGFEVKYITMDFFDNTGHTMQYLLDGRNSYNGTFTEHFSLNGKNSNTRMSRYKVINNENINWEKAPSEWDTEIIEHTGIEVDKQTAEEGFSDDYIISEEGEEQKYYENDAGIIYSGILYGVKIQVYQTYKKDMNASNEDMTANMTTDTHYRWFWTNTMYNEYYYNTEDFNSLKFELVLNSEAIFATVPQSYIWKTKEINNLNEPFDNQDYYKTYSANIQYIGENKEHNIDMFLRAGLQNDYGCFNLYNDPDGKDNKINPLSNIKTEIYLGPSTIDYSYDGEQYVFTQENTIVTETGFLSKGKTESDENIDLSKEINNEKNISLKDIFQVDFIKTEEINPEEEPVEGNIIYPKVTITLDKCYYQNDELKASIPLSLQAALYDKAYVQNTYNNNINVPVYSPIINNRDDFKSLGLDYLFYKDNDQVNIKLGFSSAMSLTHDENDDITAANFIVTKKNNNFEFSPGTSWVYDYQILAKSHVNTTNSDDFIQNVWNKISSNMQKLFLVYPGGDIETYAYSIVKGNPKNTQDVSKWFRSNWGTSTKYNIREHNITYGSYGIDNGFIFPNNNSYYKTTAFLGMKYKDGFTLFNSAFADWQNQYDDLQFTQTAYKPYGEQEFKNFAYHLYLLLSNTYHKNKKENDKVLSLKNYVRNGDYDATLTKNVIVKLSEKTGNNEEKLTQNILMRGLNFNSYVKEIKALKEFNTNDPKILEFINSKNVELYFIDSAINNTLQLTIKGKPFPLVNADVEAYILVNGELVPAYNLADNTFYIYQNGELEIYQNSLLQFNIEEVNKNLRYILSNSDIKNAKNIRLEGINPPPIKTYDEYQKAYNQFIKEVYYAAEEFNTHEIIHNCIDNIEVNNKKREFIISLYDRLPEHINGEHKSQLFYVASQQSDPTWENRPLGNYADGGIFGWYGAFETFFVIEEYYTDINGDGINDDTTYKYRLFIYPGEKRFPEMYSSLPNPNYSFNCGINLDSMFQYDNELNLIDTSYENFGMCEDPEVHDIDIMYTGFMQDVVIDTNFQVIP